MNGPTSYERSRLPPPHLQLIDFRREKIETPVDDRGLVLVEPLIDAIKATVDPAWEWREDRIRTNAHHYYWPETRYSAETADEGPIAHTFRELAIHKGFMPVGFHTWLHLVTEPPDLPQQEVMEYRIEAFRVAKSLFVAALKIEELMEKARKRAIDIAKNPERLQAEQNGIDIATNEWVERKLHSNFAGYERHLRRVEAVPEEFRIIPVDNTSRPRDIIQLGTAHLIGSRAVNLIPNILAA